MKYKYKYDTEKRHDIHDFKNWLVVYAATVIKEAGGTVEGATVELKLTGNGIELDVLEFMKRMASRLDEDINKAARKLLAEKCRGLLDEVDTLTSGVRNKGHELFPSEYDDEDY